MANPIIIDRRKNPGKKNLSNRQRFLERFRDQIKEAARKHINQRSIKSPSGQDISVPGIGTDEPRFRHGSADGNWDYVLPGNKDHIPGDHIPKPKGGQGGGGGSQGSKDGKGEDEFQFLLSYDEYLELIFDDLELPDLIKASEKVIESHQLRRAGLTTTGVPTNLNIERTSISGLSRRIALKTPKTRRIAELELLLKDEEDEDKKKLIILEIEELRARSNSIPYLDKVDLRYNNFMPQPKPIIQAVMICVMDVSYSMGEEEKTIAKKFFLLLHLFLKRRYKNIEVVFVRHHESAEECDEDTFFTSKETGGTVVSTAFEVVDKIISDRYSPEDWNIYIGQISDGDNYSSDNGPLTVLLNKIMPIVQFLSYVEIAKQGTDLLYYSNTNLWDTIARLKPLYKQINLQKISNEKDIIPIFRKIFGKNNNE